MALLQKVFQLRTLREHGVRKPLAAVHAAPDPALAAGRASGS
jgi:hypothetical protein